MSSHCDSLVTGFEHLIPAIKTPDPVDRHVVAAAIHSGASLMVIFNLKDEAHPYIIHHVTGCYAQASP